MASWTYFEPTHSSSTWSNAAWKRSGNVGSSHHDMPIVWRPAKKDGPTSCAKPGSPSALTQTRLTPNGAMVGATTP